MTEINMILKKHKVFFAVGLVIGIILLFAYGNTFAQEKYNVAVLTFEAADEELTQTAGKITDLITAFLSNEPSFQLVERNKIDDILKELGLSMTGIVDEAQAVKIGNMVGAQIMITGKAFTVDEELFITAKIIGVETSLVNSEMVTGTLNDKLSPMIKELSDKVAGTISENANTMVAKEVSLKDRIEELKTKLEGKNLPKVSVVVQETYSGSSIPDPATETEIIYILKECGFEVYDRKSMPLADWAKGYLSDNKTDMPKNTQADVIIFGEAIGEFATRRGELVSAKGRVELKAIDPKEGKVLAVDRKTQTAVDLSARIAGKKALQEATAEITPDFILRIVEALNK